MMAAIAGLGWPRQSRTSRLPRPAGSSAAPAGRVISTAAAHDEGLGWPESSRALSGLGAASADGSMPDDDDGPGAEPPARLQQALAGVSRETTGRPGAGGPDP